MGRMRQKNKPSKKTHKNMMTCRVATQLKITRWKLEVHSLRLCKIHSIFYL